MSNRFLLAILGALASVAFGGCGGPPGEEETDTQASALTTSQVTAFFDVPATFDACCNAAWNVVPTTMARYDAINEASLCNNTTDYIRTGSHSGQVPYWAGSAYNMGLWFIPPGASITAMTAVVCARPSARYLDGHFSIKATYWQPNLAGGDPAVSFLTSDGTEQWTTPRVSIFSANPFRQYSLPAASGTLITTPKPAGAQQMWMIIFGDNVEISQAYLLLTY
jgi:hypothetical protein